MLIASLQFARGPVSTFPPARSTRFARSGQASANKVVYPEQRRRIGSPIQSRHLSLLDT